MRACVRVCVCVGCDLWLCQFLFKCSCYIIFLFSLIFREFTVIFSRCDLYMHRQACILSLVFQSTDNCSFGRTQLNAPRLTYELYVQIC